VRGTAENSRRRIYDDVSAWRTDGFVNGSPPLSIRDIAFMNEAGLVVVDMLVPLLKSNVAFGAGTLIR
jgi:hypothetical protein